MKLGNAIRSIEFSEVEKNRIVSSLVQSSGLPFQVFISKIHTLDSPDFWRSAQKRFKVTGFRDGHPNARAIVLQKALDSLRTQSQLRGEIWPLYRNCVIQFVFEDLGKLNQLLQREEFIKSEGTLTEQIFRCIAIALPIYDAKISDAEKLYELWGFDRVQDLDKLIHDVPLTSAIVKRVAEAESKKVKDELSENIGKFVDDIQNFLSKKQDIVSGMENRVDELFEKTEVLEAKIDTSIGILRTEFQNLAATTFQQKAHEINQAIKKFTEESPVQDKTRTIDSDTLIRLQNQIDNLSKKLKQHDEFFVKGVANSHSNNPKPLGNSNQFKIELIFKHWKQSLLKVGITNANINLLYTILQLLRRAKIIVTDKPAAIIGVYEAMQEVEILQIAASPLWLSDSDWKQAREFISAESKLPRLLLIYDFDVAIQEAYLVPALVEWSGNQKINPCNRIILQPSKPNLAAVSSRVFELSAILNLESEWVKNAVETKDNTSYLSPEVSHVTPSELLSFLQVSNAEFEEHLKRISSNSGLEIPARLAASFVNVFLGFKEHIESQQAGKIALDTTLLPWVRHFRGDSISKVYEETLKLTFGGSI